MTQFMNSHPLSPARMTHRNGGYAHLSKANLYMAVSKYQISQKQ